MIAQQETVTPSEERLFKIQESLGQLEADLLKAKLLLKEEIGLLKDLVIEAKFQRRKIKECFALLDNGRLNKILELAQFLEKWS